MNGNDQLSGPFVALEGHVSLFSDVAEGSMLAGTFGYGGRGGYRWNSWGLYLSVEHNMWIATEYDNDVVFGAVNIAVGGEFIFARGMIRSAFGLGPSILAYDTVLDEAGSVGLFLDVRPLGLRWALNDYWLIGFDPLTFAVVAPVFDSIPLVQIEYRTQLYVEVAF